MIDRSKTIIAAARVMACVAAAKLTKGASEMLYFSRLLNAFGFVALAALIIVQRDIDGNALVIGWHGLGLALLLAFVFALLNFRGALSAAYLNERNER